MTTTLYTPTEILCLLEIDLPRNIGAFYTYTNAEFRQLTVEQLVRLGFNRSDALRIDRALRYGIFVEKSRSPPSVASDGEHKKNGHVKEETEMPSSSVDSIKTEIALSNADNDDPKS